MKSDLSPTVYILEEYTIPSCPSIMLLDVSLDIEIDNIGEWYIEELRMLDGKGKVLAFRQGDWLFDLLVNDIYKDADYCEFIFEQASEA